MPILVSLLFLGGIMVFAQAHKSAPKVKAAELKIFIGTIESITLSDPIKKTNTEIATVNEVKEKLSVVVTTKTRIYDTEGRPITLDKLKVGERVLEKYSTTSFGALDATSIRLLK